MQNIIKCYLVNIRVIGQRCGYGEGRTFQEAAENALAIARQRDPNARLVNNHVEFEPSEVRI